MVTTKIGRSILVKRDMAARPPRKTARTATTGAAVRSPRAPARAVARPVARSNGKAAPRRESAQVRAKGNGKTPTKAASTQAARVKDKAPGHGPAPGARAASAAQSASAAFNGQAAGRPANPDFSALMQDPAQWARLMWERSPQPAVMQHLPDMPQVAWQIDPARLAELQKEYSESLARLWAGMLEGKTPEPPRDKRFATGAWRGLHAYLAELYLLNARYMLQLADSIEADAKTKMKVRFAVEQWVDAMAPSNYLVTNPEVQEKLVATQGESLSCGLMNMLGDLQRGRILQTDESAFEVGRNVAVTPGDVVFENEIFQLIQYRPSTPTVHERPLLMVPPCINKFYILDLQPENSLVAHTVAAGHTVFLVSWRNPKEEQAHLTWDDYIEAGVIRAIDVVAAITAQERFNILGFCVGGTMLATALAVLAARGRRPAESLTLLTTLLDFSNTGILDVFVDEAQVRMREQSIGGLGAEGSGRGPVGLMPARELAASFSFLRPNDLVWNYVVNNYLKGETPPAFDLLYWNADSTNLPGPFFAWYLRHTYLQDELKRPGRLKVCGVPVDLGAISVPTYIYGSREDHIVPWPAAYASTRLLKGPLRFVLGASGHIAGVINPPAKKKRSYWTYDPPGGKFPARPQSWYDEAEEHPGSWWPDWHAWLSRHAGKLVPAPRTPGNTRYRRIEDAPGRYVKVRAV